MKENICMFTIMTMIMIQETFIIRDSTIKALGCRQIESKALCFHIKIKSERQKS